MAVDQKGTGSLTFAGQAAAAATYLTVPTGAIVESITTNPGGSPDFEDIMDENGAFHTRATYEKRMHTASIVLVGVAFTGVAGDVGGTSSNYYIESVSVDRSKAAIRTTVNVVLIPTIVGA